MIEKERLNATEIKILKEFLGEYLHLKGVNPRKLFRCFSKTHEDKHPSMSFYSKANICKCFACGEKYDIFKLVGQEYGIEEREQQILKTKELYENKELIENINDGIYSQKNTDVELDYSKFSKEKEKKKLNPEYIVDYFIDSKEKIRDCDYLEKRGISKDVIEEYNIGYDPYFKVYDTYYKVIVFPTSYTSYTVRNIEENSEFRYRKIGEAHLFNLWELDIAENKNKAFWIVEGEIDALSIISVGKKAISLGSINNSNLLIKAIEEKQLKNKFYLMLDNDERGKKAQNELYKTLREKNIDVECCSIPYKDPNEFLIKNRAEFIKTLNNFELEKGGVVMADLEKTKPLENYSKTEVNKLYAYVLEGENNQGIESGKIGEYEFSKKGLEEAYKDSKSAWENRASKIEIVGVNKNGEILYLRPDEVNFEETPREYSINFDECLMKKDSKYIEHRLETLQDFDEIHKTEIYKIFMEYSEYDKVRPFKLLHHSLYVNNDKGSLVADQFIVNINEENKTFTVYSENSPFKNGEYNLSFDILNKVGINDNGNFLRVISHTQNTIEEKLASYREWKEEYENRKYNKVKPFEFLHHSFNVINGQGSVVANQFIVNINNENKTFTVYSENNPFNHREFTLSFDTLNRVGIVDGDENNLKIVKHKQDTIEKKLASYREWKEEYIKRKEKENLVKEKGLNNNNNKSNEKNNYLKIEENRIYAFVLEGINQAGKESGLIGEDELSKKGIENIYEISKNLYKNGKASKIKIFGVSSDGTFYHSRPDKSNFELSKEKYANNLLTYTKKTSDNENLKYRIEDMEIIDKQYNVGILELFKKLNEIEERSANTMENKTQINTIEKTKEERIFEEIDSIQDIKELKVAKRIPEIVKKLDSYELDNAFSDSLEAQKRNFEDMDKLRKESEELKKENPIGYQLGEKIAEELTKSNPFDDYDIKSIEKYNNYIDKKIEIIEMKKNDKILGLINERIEKNVEKGIFYTSIDYKNIRETLGIEKEEFNQEMGNLLKTKKLFYVKEEGEKIYSDGTIKNEEIKRRYFTDEKKFTEFSNEFKEKEKIKNQRNSEARDKELKEKDEKVKSLSENAQNVYNKLKDKMQEKNKAFIKVNDLKKDINLDFNTMKDTIKELSSEKVVYTRYITSIDKETGKENKYYIATNSKKYFVMVSEKEEYKAKLKENSVEQGKAVDKEIKEEKNEEINNSIPKKTSKKKEKDGIER